MKKIIALLSLSLLSLMSFSNGKYKEQQPQFINLKVTIDEASLILKGLGELPLKESGALSQNILQQAQKQLTDTTKKK